MIIRFASDYSEGCYPQILSALAKTNGEQTSGYGTDPYCEKARAQLRFCAEAPEADVHFVTGGTQANIIVITALLRPHQGVIAADTGHISVHETGAVEATGHKVLPLLSKEGKITAAQVEKLVNDHYDDPSREHTVQPGMVYLSQPTETGVLYTKEELSALSRVCREYHLPLYVDGARLAYALSAEANDVTLPDLARLCDVLCVGGTKCGALFGEAVMIFHPALKTDFRYIIKQRGGMLAKGRLLGVQFLTLFSDGLYLEGARAANRYADLLRDVIKKTGIPFWVETNTNQIFPILNDDYLQFLSDRYEFEPWQRIDDTHTAVRICTSWATTADQVDALTDSLKALRL